MQINVVTEQFMADFALFELNQVLDAIPGTARTYDDFFPDVNVRGFDSLSVLRNGVRASSPPDMTSVARIETIKGPAGLAYGWAQPGGVLNYITKNPAPTRKATVLVSAGSNDLFRSELDATGPINRAGTFNYRLGLTSYSLKNGERERSKDRVVFAPMLQWRPFSDTSITVRYSNMHDDIRPADGLVLKPTGAINRGGDPSQFYPFNGLDAVRNPQWVTSVGPGFVRDSPSSYRDFKPVIWELEATQRLNSAIELRCNFAYFRRAISAIRESGASATLVNPWIQGPVIAQLNGYNGWNLDNTRGDPFPEAQLTYQLAGRSGAPAIGNALADTRLLNGEPYVYNPAVCTLQYVDGVTGWRRIMWNGNNRRDRRVNGQIDLVTRFRTGPLYHTLLTSLEHNDEHRWENNSLLLRDPSRAAGAAYTIPGDGAQVPNQVDYWYNIFDPASTAARDAFARRNLPPLSGFTSNGISDDRAHAANSFYANWSVAFFENRGRLVLGGRYDEASARLIASLPGTNPVGFGGPVVSRLDGTNARATPQAGLSFRISDSVTTYGLYSQSVNPVTSFQPARNPRLEDLLRDRYQAAGLPAPNLDAMPWGQYLAPAFGEGVEGGVKTEFFAGKAMVNIGCFVIDRKNIARLKPDTDPDSVASFWDLTGAQRARGIDIDFHTRPFRGLQIGGGGLYNQTEVVAVNATTLPTSLATTFAATSGPPAPYSLLGQRTPNAPKWSGNGYLRYEFQDGATKGVALGVSYNYMGPRREDNNLRWSEAWSRWDANVSYRRKLLERTTRFSLVVRNVTDRTFRVDRDTFAQRRQFVGSVSVEL